MEHLVTSLRHALPNRSRSTTCIATTGPPTSLSQKVHNLHTPLCPPIPWRCAVRYCATPPVAKPALRTALAAPLPPPPRTPTPLPASRRCLCASPSTIAPATAAFSDSTPPCKGTLTPTTSPLSNPRLAASPSPKSCNGAWTRGGGIRSQFF